MHEYEIFHFDNDIYDNVILITGTEDLYYLQDDIFDELSKLRGDNFNILVDLFLRNGFSFNRFVLLNYDGKDKCSSFIINPREVSEEIKATIRKYLKLSPSLLENSALSINIISFIRTVA